MFRLKSVLLAISRLRGSTLRYTLFLTIVAPVWALMLFLVAPQLDAQWIVLAAAGPALTLGGYIAGMMWPHWRVNWIVRVGAVQTLLATLWLFSAAPPMVALLLTWMPAVVAISMLIYHEHKSIFRDPGAGSPSVGEQFPNFDLQDHEGRQLNRTAALAGGAALFLFYRGDW